MVFLGHFVIHISVATNSREAYLPALPNNLLSNFIVFGMVAESSYLSCRDDII